MVGHGQGVAQLHPQGHALSSGHLLEPGDHLHGPAILQVVLEDPVGDVDLPEAEVLVQDG